MSATGATGPADPWASELVIITERVDDVRSHWADGQDGLTGGLGPAYPAPLDTTGAQLGVDSGDSIRRLSSRKAITGKCRWKPPSRACNTP